jgi:hypothetical protein
MWSLLALSGQLEEPGLPDRQSILRKTGIGPHGDLLREGARLLPQWATDWKVRKKIGAAR